jgi:hypothetical protein
MLEVLIMAFDSFIAPKDAHPQYTDSYGANSHTDAMELVNYLLDSSHGHSGQRPQIFAQPNDAQTESPVVKVIANGAEHGFSGNDDIQLRQIFNLDFHRQWWKGEPVADLVNKQLQDAGSNYRIRFDGPFKAPDSHPEMYEYRLTVTDLQGRSLNQLPMTYVKD